jgi:hypothetical protein
MFAAGHAQLAGESQGQVDSGVVGMVSAIRCVLER